MKAFEGNDWTPEECYLLETALSSRPNRQRVFRGILEVLDDKINELAANGETVSCYTDDTEHALHPDGFTWADSSSPVVPLQRSGNQVDTPVERAS